MSEETGMQDMHTLREKGLKFPRISLVPDASFPVNFAQKGSVDANLAFPCAGNLLAFDAGTVRNIIPDYAQCTLDVPVEEAKAAFSALDESLIAPVTITEDESGRCRISAAGRAGHAAFPAAGDNAIRRLSGALAASGLLKGSCARAIAAVAQLTEDAYGESEGVAYRDDISGELTLVYGVAHLNEGVLTLFADCRYPITCDGLALEKGMRAAWEARGCRIQHFDLSPAFYIPREDAAVQMLQGIYQAATGRDDEPYTMGGGTYSQAVPNAISFGPGIPGAYGDWSAILPEGHGGAHGRDEAIRMQKIHDCCRIYTAAIAALDEITP